MTQRKWTTTRRGFLAGAAGLVVQQGVSAITRHRTRGANNRIQIGLIGCGYRGGQLLDNLHSLETSGADVTIDAVCDAHEPRRRHSAKRYRATEVRRWEDLVTRSEIDAVIIATPDHSHAPMAIAALQAGKDVYCEAPLGLRLEEAAQVCRMARETDRVFQLGIEECSQAQWHAARGQVQKGVLGKLRWSQAVDQRNARGIAAPPALHSNVDSHNLDWDAFLGTAPKHRFDGDRFLHWKDYGTYSRGVAAASQLHLLAPLLIALGPETPESVTAMGGNFTHAPSHAPDTLISTIRYPSGHSVVLHTSTANTNHHAPIIRGEDAAIELQGQSLRVTDERIGHANPPSRVVEVPEARPSHFEDWLNCLRTRATCTCPPSLAYKTQVAVHMALDACRRQSTVSAHALA